MKNVVWLTPPNFSGGLQHLLNKYIRSAGIDLLNLKFLDLTTGCLIKKSKTKYTWDMNKYPAFSKALKSHKPDLIVVNDKAALGFLTQKYISLALCRGGIYYWNDIPCLVIDDVKKTKSTRTGGWVLLNDLGKLKRWTNGTQRREPVFNHKVCCDIANIKECYARCKNAIAITCDIETSGVTQTCIGYTIWENSGEIITYVVPFVDTTKETGCFWDSEEDEVLVWQTVKQINALPVVKCFQNGQYDNAYLVRDRVPVINWTADTLHMWHSIWTEAPKRLDFISSIALDYYRYWKDEGKENAKEDVKGGAIPHTKSGLENYWLYNALDCYNTMMNMRFLVTLLTQTNMEWALRNYVEEILQQTGPAFAMSMRGAFCNEDIKAQQALDLFNDAEQAEKDLLTMVDDPEFNSNSPPQVAELIYDVLKAKPVKKGKDARGTEEPLLKLIATQHPLYDAIIEQIWAKKKPANNNSKYGSGLRLLNNRYMYCASASGTTSGRYSTKGHQFWLGSNVQNIPDPMRGMIEADKGYVLVDADYAQSDAYFTAFSSGDKQFIANMLSPHDTHCIHAAHFFKRNFDELIAAKKAKEDWCVHKVTGIRSITKRVVYGANYLMEAFTLYITMGKKSVVAAAIALGYKNAGSWEDKKLILLCDMFLKAYFQLYPDLQPWLQEELSKAASNGNKAACAGGRTRIFFGDLLHDKKLQKEFASYWGQGGTAGNINTALKNIFYGGLEKEGVMLLFQVHDSIVFQVPESKLDLIPKVLDAMRNECEIYGRKFVVPVEAQVGKGWGKRMIDWHEGITLADIKMHDAEWRKG